MKNVVENCKVIIEDKSFIDKNGQKIDFVEIVAEIQGVPVVCKVKPSDKALLGYIRSQLPKA